MLVIVLPLSGCGKKVEIPEAEVLIDEDCQELCLEIKETCPELIDINECKNECVDWREETKESIREADNCEEISEILEYVPEFILEPEQPNLSEPTSDCEAACGHYVIACLTLVPNATEDLFNEGYESCLSECKNWDANKVDCMITAFDCEAMTDVCGL